MRTNKVKILTIIIFAISVFAVLFFQRDTVQVKAEGDVAAEYKAKCAMCHTANASKAYDPAKPDADHIQIILKGKKGEKPPYMPAFADKGMTEEQAKVLAEYMRKLRTPETANTNAASNTMANSANANCANTSANAAQTVISEETIAFYKKTCLMCHTATASKAFDPTKEDAILEEVVLNGKKAEKPPHMPEYKSKGVTAEQAKALVVYMKRLKAEAK